MNTIQEILAFIMESLGTLFLLFVILRFFLQLARADFYNPFSQAVVKITNPVLIPLRRIIPGVFGIDIASIVLALLVQILIGELIYFAYTLSLMNPLNLLIWGVIGTLKVVTYMAFVCLIVLVITSFIAPYSTHPALMLIRQLLEPVLSPMRRIIPPVGGLDFSVMFVFMGLVIVQKLVDAVAVSTRLNPLLIVGY